MRLSAPPMGPKNATFGVGLRWLSLLLPALVYMGCLDNSCEQISETPVIYTGGTTNASKSFYQSSTPNEPFLRFPAGRAFRMEHGLGQKPSSYEVFVSFLADGGDQVIGAGNLALLNVDAQYIRVTNDTCSDLFVRATASVVAENADTQDEVDGNTDAGSADTGASDLVPRTMGDAN
jgi:hypothetical protein